MKKATRSILSAAVAVSMAATACPVSFAATTSNEVTAREKANAALAREAAAQGMVLLENKNNSLRLRQRSWHCSEAELYVPSEVVPVPVIRLTADFPVAVM